MVRMLAIAKLLALLAFSVLCIIASIQTYTVGNHLSITIMKLDDSIDKINGKHGTLQELNKTIVDSKNLIARADMLVEQESNSIAKQNKLLENTVRNANTLVSFFNSAVASTASNAQSITLETNSLLRASTTSVEALQPTLAQAILTLGQLQAVTGHLDKLISDPALPATIANVQSTTGHLDATAADVQQEVHKYTHPGIWAKIKGVVLDVAHVFNPL